MNKLRKFIEEAGWPRILIAAFLALTVIKVRLAIRNERAQK